MKKKEETGQKPEYIAFRATTKELHNIDQLARVARTTRSSMLRRLIPDLSPEESKVPCSA